MIQNLPDYISTYVKKFSSKDYEIEWQTKSGINNVVVVPAIAEYENIKGLIASLLKNNSEYFESTLVLFVINNSPVSPRAVKENNQKALDLLRKIISDEDKQLGLSIGLIDAASKGNELVEKNSAHQRTL